jgi:hypothetical protein
MLRSPPAAGVLAKLCAAGARHQALALPLQQAPYSTHTDCLLSPLLLQVSWLTGAAGARHQVPALPLYFAATSTEQRMR